MNAFQLQWPEPGLNSTGMLLLVEVAPHQAEPGHGLPCRVLGSISPGSPFLREERGNVPATQVTSLLAAIGVPTNLRGYGYLRTALMLAAEHPEMLRKLNGQVYPAIAAEHGATPGAVERAIRHAIEQTWIRGGGERCYQILGRASSCVGDRPSNGEFLTMLTEYLGLMRW